MRSPRGVVPALLTVLLAAPLAVGQEAGTAVVTMADGTTEALSSVKVSYEYMTWPSGQTQVGLSPRRREMPSLVVGEEVLPLRGSVVALRWEEKGGRAIPVEVSSRPAGGKASVLKMAAPDKDLILPESEKKANFAPRSLDIEGQTFTGTRRMLCVLSYSPQVECGQGAADRVVKIEFGS